MTRIPNSRQNLGRPGIVGRGRIQVFPPRDSSPAVFEYWDPAKTSPSVKISNYNLTLTKSGAVNGNTLALGKYAVWGGKWYFESIHGFATQANTAIGIAASTANFADGAWAGQGPDTIGYWSDGTVFNANALLTTLQTWTSGSNVGVAFDLINNKFWVRPNGGNWNNDVIANQDPATNTGGIAIPFAVAATGTVPCSTVFQLSPPDSVTAKFSAAEWSYTPPVGFSALTPGVSRPPGTDSIFVRQQQPDHPLPLPMLAAGPQGPNVGPPVTIVLVTRQEQPSHPLPALAAGRHGPNVRPPVADTVLTRQEQPAHPLPVLAAGRQGPNVASPPQIGSTVGQQEQPRHPGPFLWTNFTIQPSVSVPATTNWITERQEQPVHPLPSLAAGVQGPNVRPSVTDALLTRQEQPAHPLPTLSAQALPNIRRVVADTIITRQEQPAHPLPTFFSTSPAPPPQFVPLLPVFTRQEQPAHPLPILAAGRQGPNVRSAVTDTILVRQEQPAHPPPTFFSSSPTTIRRPVTDTILVRQYQPDHPLPALLAGVYTQPTFHPPLPFQPVLTAQEMPRHPAPWAWAIPPIPTPLPPPPPPPSFVMGRTVVLQSDSVVSRPSPQPRTVMLQADIPLQRSWPQPRIVVLQSDQGVKTMQLPALLQFGETGPMDNDPFTADATKWLALVAGDSLTTAAVTVTNTDGTPQTSVTTNATVFSGSLVTVWLSGGVPGTNYLVVFHLSTTSGRSDYKSVGLQCVASRS